jgi:hypothetical protein
LIQEGTDVENTTEIESNIDADPTFISKYDIYESSELDHKVTNVENKIQIGGDTHSDVNFFSKRTRICNSIEKVTMEGRYQDDYSSRNHFCYRNMEPTVMDKVEGTRAILTQSLSRSSSTSSLDSTNIDVLNTLTCDDLDFFFDVQKTS